MDTAMNFWNSGSIKTFEKWCDGAILTSGPAYTLIVDSSDTFEDCWIEESDMSTSYGYICEKQG